MALVSQNRFSRLAKGVVRYADILMNKRPVLINLEVIKSCNATCHFCRCWTLEAGPRLLDYSPVIQKIRPMVVSINGGEPLLRADICDIVRQVKPHTLYTAIITNGALLTLKKAEQLIQAGLDQITISLDYLDDRHNQVRGIPNLVEHIFEIIPQIKATGFDNIVFNTIIMNSNLDTVVSIAKKAYELGVKVSYSAYASVKADNDTEVILGERQKKLIEVIRELKELKKVQRNILSSDYFFNQVPLFFEHKKIGGCKAGQRWVTVTPDGYVQPCSETPRVTHYTEYSPEKFGDIDCDVCWYACRAESQAPVTLRRIGGWVRQ